MVAETVRMTQYVNPVFLATTTTSAYICVISAQIPFLIAILVPTKPCAHLASALGLSTTQHSASYVLLLWRTV